MTAYNGNIARLTIVGVWNGQVTNNVTYWDRETGAWDADGLDDLGVAVAGWVQDTLAPLLSEQIAFNRVDCLSMVGPEAPFASTFFGTPVLGGVEAVSVANNVAACMTISTAFSGRTARGRQYVPGLPQPTVSANIISPTMVTALNAAYQDLLGLGTSSGFRVGVYSQFLGGVERPAGVFRQAIAIQLRDNIVDSQRRRLPGRGI